MRVETASSEDLRAIPRHDAHDAAKLGALVASMDADGWRGRPLLAVETCNGYRLLTGSHRYAAIQQLAEPIDVPIAIVDADAVDAACDAADMTADELITECLDDDDLAALLADLDDEAAALMGLEG
jgi:hypothetical protein